MLQYLFNIIYKLMKIQNIELVILHQLSVILSSIFSFVTQKFFIILFTYCGYMQFKRLQLWFKIEI